MVVRAVRQVVGLRGRGDAGPGGEWAACVKVAERERAGRRGEDGEAAAKAGSRQAGSESRVAAGVGREWGGGKWPSGKGAGAGAAEWEGARPETRRPRVTQTKRSGVSVGSGLSFPHCRILCFSQEAGSAW